MNVAQEKAIIRTLVKAGKETLAKSFAVSRGYRVRGINLNPKDLFGVEPGPDTRSKLLRKFQDTPKGGKLQLGGVTYLVSSVHGYVEPPPGAPSKLPKPKPGKALDPLHYMIIGHDLARKGELEQVPGTGNYREVPYIRTLIIDIPTDTVLVYPWESGKFDSQGIPTRGKPQKVKASIQVRAGDLDAGHTATSCEATMNKTQEKDIIRVLVKAGKETLAKTFARSRGYGVEGKGRRVTAARKHKDVEYQVGNMKKTYSTFDEAAATAVSIALSHGATVQLDTLVYSEAGAKWLMGDDGVEMYREDPDASVFERIQIKANSEGRIP